jgi:predicted transcriptional regulator
MMTKNWLYLPRWQEIVISIADNDSISDVRKKSKIAGYDIVHHVIQAFVKKNWVTLKKIGRMQVISLTPEGRFVQTRCQEIAAKGIVGIKRRIDQR